MQLETEHVAATINAVNYSWCQCHVLRHNRCVM